MPAFISNAAPAPAKEKIVPNVLDQDVFPEWLQDGNPIRVVPMAEPGELDENEEIPTEEIEDKDRFKIDSEEKATWLVNKLLELDERDARITAQYENMVGQIRRDKQRLVNRFYDELKAWAQANTTEKSRTIKLLTGTLSLREVPGGLRIGDKDALLSWAKQNMPEAVTADTVEKVDAKAVKAKAEEIKAAGGELPAGLVEVPDADELYVKAVRKTEAEAKAAKPAEEKTAAKPTRASKAKPQAAAFVPF